MWAFFVFFLLSTHNICPQIFALFEILNIHFQSGNFLNYDQQFCMIHESTNHPWHRPLESFYVKSILRKDSQTPNTNNSNNKHFQIISRFGGRSSATKSYNRECTNKFFFKFQDGEFCKEGCPFRHQCELFHGNHGSYKCPERFPGVTIYLGETGSNINSTGLGESQRLPHNTPAKAIPTPYTANTNQGR